MEERYRNSNRISGRRLQARRLAISAAFALTLGASATEPQVDVVADVGHQGPIDGMTYSSDGRWLMTSGRPSDGTTRLWFESRLRYVLPGSRAAMPPSGELVVTGSEDAFRQLGAIRRWDLATGRMKWEALGREVHSFAVTPDGTSLVALGKDKSYQVWDIETGEVRQRLAGFAPGLGEIFVSPLGTWVATRYRNTIATWELSTGQARCLLAEEPNSVRQLTFAPREQFIVAAGKGTVRLWDPETCELRHRFETDDERLDRGLVSPDGAYVLASSSRQAWLWHRESGEVVYQATELEPCAAFSAIAFHPLGDWAAIGRRDGRIDLVAPEIGMPIQTLKSSFGPSLLVPHPDGTELTAGAHGINFLRLKSDNYTKRGRQSHLKLEALYLSEDAEQLVAQNAKFASIWDLASSQPPVVLEGGRSIASSDGSLVAVGPGNHQSRDPSVRIWQRETRQILAEVAHEVEVTSFALEPTGDLLATGAMDGGVRIWEAGTGRLLQQLQGPAEKVDAMVWIEAGQALVVGFHDGSLWVWDLGATEPRAVLPHPEGEPVWRLEALPTRGVVLAQIANGDAYLRNHSEQQLIGRIGRRTSVDAIAATNDGRFAVMDFAKRHPLVWSIENDQALFALEGRDALVQALAFDVHGEQFLTGGLDGALGLSSARNGRLKSLHRVSPVGISAIELHPEGRFLILGDQDGVLRFWSVAEQREIVRVLLHREWLWAVLAPDGRWDAWGGEKVALADLVAWSGLEPGYLSNHPENFAPGLLAEVLRPYQE